MSIPHAKPSDIIATVFRKRCRSHSARSVQPIQIQLVMKRAHANAEGFGCLFAVAVVCGEGGWDGSFLGGF